MNPNKRQDDTMINDSNNSKKKKPQYPSLCFTGTTINTHRNSITHFENLSNEVIYEIFEFVDTYQVYESFFDLNIRFRNLCIYSNLPIHINISSISKSTFQRYYTYLIMHNKHRINSIHLSDPFIIDFFSSSTQNISKCSQLQQLSLDKIESQHIENLLSDLASLSNLSSLTISIGLGSNANTLWNFILKLPVLKYCKISFEDNTYFGLLPMSTNTPSSIERLVITGKLTHTVLDAILSYVPHLRRLSINYLYGNYNQGTYILSSVVNKLTHVSLILDHVLFNQFESFIKKYFSQIQVIHITSNYDMRYIDAPQWEKLILTHMPYLRIFDIQYTYELDDRNKYEIFYSNAFEKFTSPFWIEKQWFFAHDSNFGGPLTRIFYSIQPYRRKYFSLTGELDLNNYACQQKTVFDSVERVIIQDERMIGHSSKYFPNAKELTISDQRNDRSRRSTTISIDHIVVLDQLTKLTIDYGHRPFSKILDLLSCTPNVHTLVFKRLIIVSTDYFPLQQSEKFRLVSNKNKIKNLTILFDYSLRNIQLLINLSPELEHISIGTSDSCLESTMELLLSKTTCHLSSVCISGIDTIKCEKMKTLIESNKLLIDYSIKVIHRNFYLWW